MDSITTPSMDREFGIGKTVDLKTRVKADEAIENGRLLWLPKHTNIWHWSGSIAALQDSCRALSLDWDLFQQRYEYVDEIPKAAYEHTVIVLRTYELPKSDDRPGLQMIEFCTLTSWPNAWNGGMRIDTRLLCQYISSACRTNHRNGGFHITENMSEPPIRNPRFSSDRFKKAGKNRKHTPSYIALRRYQLPQILFHHLWSGKSPVNLLELDKLVFLIPECSQQHKDVKTEGPESTVNRETGVSSQSSAESNGGQEQQGLQIEVPPTVVTVMPSPKPYVIPQHREQHREQGRKRGDSAVALAVPARWSRSTPEASVPQSASATVTTFPSPQPCSPKPRSRSASLSLLGPSFSTISLSSTPPRSRFSSVSTVSSLFAHFPPSPGIPPTCILLPAFRNSSPTSPTAPQRIYGATFAPLASSDSGNPSRSSTRQGRFSWFRPVEYFYWALGWDYVTDVAMEPDLEPGHGSHR